MRRVFSDWFKGKPFESHGAGTETAVISVTFLILLSTKALNN
jgi:hypothetical protein